MARADGDISVTILHVSDTQFGQYHRFGAPDSLASHLIRDITRLPEIGVPPIDLIVLSGDVGERGKRKEYEDASSFIRELLQALNLDRERVVVVPGNHDVSWNLSRSYFEECEDADTTPDIPYAKKWRHYQDFVTELHGPTAFTEEQPYRLHRFDDLRLVVAAMNSTIKESHREQDHYGWCGSEQLRWFASQMTSSEGLLRIGVLHHNARRRAEADNENLTDEKDLTNTLGDHLDLLLHGHTHEGKEDRLSDGTLVLATGSAAVSADWRPDEVENQYQVITLRPGQVTRWARQWDSQAKRWIADVRASRSGNDRSVRLRLDTPGWDRKEETTSSKREQRHDLGKLNDGFAAQVETVTRLDLGQGNNPDRAEPAIALKSMTGDFGRRLFYLLAFQSGAPLRCVGIIDGDVDQVIINEIDSRIFAPLRSRGAVDQVIVHHGRDNPALRVSCRERRIHLKTWTEYNNLLELGAYRSWLRDELDADRLYPQRLYLPQRFREIDRFGRASADVRQDLLDEVCGAVLEEDARFVLVLGDAGYGKSFLVRRLAYRLIENQDAGLTPIVIYLRDRDKRQSLDEMVSAALLQSRAQFQIDRFQHSLEAGNLVLLIDGYDEFAVRVGYANAAAQLSTFTDALRGRAKLMLTTRPSHFRSADEVTTSLFDSLRNKHVGRVCQLEPFDTEQQRAFLFRWFELADHPDPGQLAGKWMRALGDVDNLPELARTPRMLSFIVEDLSLDELQNAASEGIVTAAQLYQKLLTHWLSTETLKIDPDAPGTIAPDQRQELLEELALRLWRTGERDVTEDALQQTARSVLDLPRHELTLDQAAQEAGGRTLLQVGAKRWRFAHQSIWEYLLARRLAFLLRTQREDELMGEAQLTGLTIRFLRDLAPDEAAAWARRIASGT